jgi:alpha-D-ribose 1-methylphosphonate 5-triphosphate synthase subunit PhnH
VNGKFDIEKVNRHNFRSCLAALAEPGKTQPLIPLFDSELLALASLLLYPEVGYHYRGTLDFQLIEAISGAQHTAVVTADYLFADHPDLELLREAKIGAAESPEFCATLVFGWSPAGQQEQNVRLHGPGIDGLVEVALPFTTQFFELLQERNSSFPMGVDLLLIDPDLCLLGLPRTTRIEVRG